MSSKRKEKRRIFKCLALITQFGINMLVPILICTFLGVWLDTQLGTKFIVVILFFMGALAGFRNIFIMSRDIFNDSDDEPRKH